MKAFVLVKSREAEKIKEYLEGRKEIIQAFIVYGGYDLLLEVEFPGIEELGRFVLKEIRDRFHVDETQTLIVAG
jgi:DNA-binding Lrp family transcriptional regulator